MPEWATDKQIVPPHTMIEEHCLQNAEDDTGRDVFCTQETFISKGDLQLHLSTNKNRKHI